jgi:type 1 glutamine amidotransferase
MHRWTAAGALACALSCAAANTGPIRLLIVADGPAAHRETAVATLRHALTETGRFEVRVTEEPATLLADGLAGYDAVLIDTVIPRGPTEHALTRFVESGKGLTVLRGLPCTLCGQNPASAGAALPAPARALRVQWRDRSHPLSAGLPAEFLTVDRVRSARGHSAAVNVLATSRSNSNDDSQPAVWALVRGRGRVLQTSLGENPALFREPAFLDAVGRGVEWAATGRVTLKPATSQRAPAPEPVRAVVVTGGHTYAPSFDTLWDSPGIAAIVDPHPMPLRRADLKKRYDVMVLYDSMLEAGETESRNLKDFLESGKGLVVLHHALVDFCNWKWWYEEVVGGRWIETEPGSGQRMPPVWKTTWKEGVELLAYPVAEHQVLGGVGPLHLWDETYKGMWLSPGNRVLMRTDDPTSDGPVVWISPYRKSRVVVIELGHGPASHLHPGYQRLVRNAVMWAAGKQ